MKTNLLVAVVGLLLAAGCSTAQVQTHDFPVVIGQASAPGARDARQLDARQEQGLDRGHALLE